MGIYNAPVVSNRYKKVVNHFQNKSKSNAVEIRGLGDQTLNNSSSINLQVTANAARLLNNQSHLPTQLETISTREEQREQEHSNVLASQQHISLDPVRASEHNKLLAQTSVTPELTGQNKAPLRQQSHRIYDQKVSQKRTQAFEPKSKEGSLRDNAGTLSYPSSPQVSTVQ